MKNPVPFQYKKSTLQMLNPDMLLFAIGTTMQLSPHHHDQFLIITQLGVPTAVRLPNPFT